MLKYQRNTQLAARIIDGLAFIVTPDDNKLHTLNATATRLWLLAGEATGCTIDDGVADLVARFRVDEGQARVDVSTCLEDLARRRILIPSE